MQVVVYRPESGRVAESPVQVALPSYAEYAEMLPAMEKIIGDGVEFADFPGNSKYAVWFRSNGLYIRGLRPNVLGLVGPVVVVPFKRDGFRSATDSDVKCIARLVRSGVRFDNGPIRVPPVLG